MEMGHPDPMPMISSWKENYRRADEHLLDHGYQGAPTALLKLKLLAELVHRITAALQRNCNLGSGSTLIF